MVQHCLMLVIHPSHQLISTRNWQEILQYSHLIGFRPCSFLLYQVNLRNFKSHSVMTFFKNYTQSGGMLDVIDWKYTAQAPSPSSLQFCNVDITSPQRVAGSVSPSWCACSALPGQIRLIVNRNFSQIYKYYQSRAEDRNISLDIWFLQSNLMAQPTSRAVSAACRLSISMRILVASPAWPSRPCCSCCGQQSLEWRILNTCLWGLTRQSRISMLKSGKSSWLSSVSWPAWLLDISRVLE